MAEFKKELDDKACDEVISDIAEEEQPYKKEPKQNYVIYTIISIILFFIVYFGVEFVSGKINADYYMEIEGSVLTDEQKMIISEYASVDSTDISSIKLKRINRKSTVIVYFDNINDAEEFVSEQLLYEYGDVVEDLRIEIYPYGNETLEFVYANSYVNIDNPNIYCYVYEFSGKNFAEYYSDELTSEISALFMDAEKIYM